MRYRLLSFFSRCTAVYKCSYVCVGKDILIIFLFCSLLRRSAVQLCLHGQKYIICYFVWCCFVFFFVHPPISQMLWACSANVEYFCELHKLTLHCYRFLNDSRTKSKCIKRLKKMLSIRTKYENFQGNPLYEATKWHLNSKTMTKMRWRATTLVFLVKLCSFHVQSSFCFSFSSFIFFFLFWGGGLTVEQVCFLVCECRRLFVSNINRDCFLVCECRCLFVSNINRDCFQNAENELTR